MVSKPHLWRMLDQWVASTPSPPNGGIDNRLDNAPRNSKDLESFAIPPQHPKTTHSAESAGDAMGYFPGVDPAQLENIRDNKMSTSEDWAVAMSWFNILQKTDPATLRRASIGPVTYAQLLRQPRSYCGRLVTVSGVVRRVHRLEVFRSPGDTDNIREYYQAWLFPIDNPHSPIVVCAMELPAGFPTGMTIAEDATVTGFFLKCWLYTHGDTFRTAPTLLAKTLEWQKRPVLAPATTPDGWTSAWILLGTVLAAALSAWYVYAYTKPSRLVSPGVPPNFDVLEQMDSHHDA